MAVYINGIGAITIQDTLVEEWFESEAKSYATTHVRCIDPVFRAYLDPIAARRMSRIVKRAIITSDKAIEESGIMVPDIIISGTGLGCVEDTEKFLEAMVRQGETLLPPTHFIQSTHNTISSQIAIHLKCYGYNNTHVQRGVSFESALLEGVLLLNSGQGSSALIGGHDELTPAYFTLLKRIGYWRDEIADTLHVIENRTKGSFAGEGSVAVMLSNEKSKSSYAQVVRIEILFAPDDLDVMVDEFLQRAGYTIDDIDVVMTGENGDKQNDAVYETLYKEKNTAHYKHLCGEYYTATGFGLMCAANVLKKNRVPEFMSPNGKQIEGVKNVLIHNHSHDTNHSLTLLGIC